jgi:hypothetical protein
MPGITILAGVHNERCKTNDTHQYANAVRYTVSNFFLTLTNTLIVMSKVCL